jgi:monofunctional biosynthetic peptidoglycan transglycosylase
MSEDAAGGGAGAETEPVASRAPFPGLPSKGDGEPLPPRGRGRRLLRRGSLALLGLVMVVLIVETARWPDVKSLRAENPRTTAFIERYRTELAAKGRAGAGRQLDWRWTPYERISAPVKHAVLVAEDINFFTHGGFAIDELRTAVLETFLAGKPPRGASTLTQQLAKNLWLTPSRNPWRKVKEALLVVQLERQLEKRRILELYLNVVELGEGIYGVESAARRYFGLSAAQLDADQAAALAASLPRPSSWHPGSSSRGYRTRVETIRRRMNKAVWITWQI